MRPVVRVGIVAVFALVVLWMTIVSVFAVNLSDGVVAYYPFDSNMSSIVGGYASTSYGTIDVVAPGIPSGASNGSLFWNNAGALQIASTGIDSENVTFNFWVNITGADAYDNVFTSGSGPSYQLAFGEIVAGCSTNESYLCFEVGANDGASIDFSSYFNTSTMITIRRFENLTSELFINGVSVSSRTYGTLLNFSQLSIFFGRQSADTDRYANGAGDELGIWTRTLSDAEIDALYDAGEGSVFPFEESPPSPPNGSIITACGEIPQYSSGMYYLNSTINMTGQNGVENTYWSGDSCLIFNESIDITLDCQGNVFTGAVNDVESTNFTSVMGFMYPSGNVTVKNCVFEDVGVEGAYHAGIIVYTFDGAIVLENNTFRRFGGGSLIDISVGDGEVTITNNVFEDLAHVGDLLQTVYVDGNLEVEFSNNVWELKDPEDTEVYMLHVESQVVRAEIFGNSFIGPADFEYSRKAPIATFAGETYIYNNSFHNAWPLNDDSSGSIYLNTTIGNLYTNDAETGFSETCVDGNYDGVCDDPYLFGDVEYSFTIATDEIPIAEVVGQNANVVPYCNFVPSSWPSNNYYPEAEGLTFEVSDPEDANINVTIYLFTNTPVTLALGNVTSSVQNITLTYAQIAAAVGDVVKNAGQEADNVGDMPTRSISCTDGDLTWNEGSSNDGLYVWGAMNVTYWAIDGRTSAPVEFCVAGNGTSACGNGSATVEIVGGVQNLSFNASGYYDVWEVRQHNTTRPSNVTLPDIIDRKAFFSRIDFRPLLQGSVTIEPWSASTTNVSIGVLESTFQLGSPDQEPLGILYTPYYDQYVVEYVGQDPCYVESPFAVTVRHAENNTIVGTLQSVSRADGVRTYVATMPVLLESGELYKIQQEAEFGIQTCTDRYSGGYGAFWTGQTYVFSSGHVNGSANLFNPTKFVNMTVGVPVGDDSVVWSGNATHVLVQFDDTAVGGANFSVPGSATQSYGLVAGGDVAFAESSGKQLWANVTRSVEFMNGTVIRAVSGQSVLVPIAWLPTGQEEVRVRVAQGISPYGVGPIVWNVPSYNLGLRVVEQRADWRDYAIGAVDVAATVNVTTSRLTFPMNIQPGGVVLTSSRNVDVSWDAATGGVVAPTYTVVLSNGTNTTIATTGDAQFFYNLSRQSVTDAYVVVSATDGYVVTENQGLPFNVSLGIAIEDLACPAITLPNELDLPVPATMNVAFNVTTEIEGVYVVEALLNASVMTCNATGVVEDTTSYVCTVPMNFYTPAGMYEGIVNVTLGMQSTTGSTGVVCEYAQLVASQRLTNLIRFPAAAPGVVDAPGDVPIVVRNTGNVPLELSVTAQNLAGRVNPAYVLSAGVFKAGAVLGSAVTMQDATPVSVNMTVSVGASSFQNVSLWVSMPLSQVSQEYYTPVPWQLVASG
jgi:hypothetical protein